MAIMNWRTMASLQDGTEALLTLGTSLFQVSNLYQSAFHEVLADELKSKVININAQKWIGNEKKGNWITYATLYVPYSSKN